MRKRGFLNKRLLEKVRGSIKEDNEPPLPHSRGLYFSPIPGAATFIRSHFPVVSSPLTSS